MLALDASLVVHRKGSQRRIAAAEFFQGIFQTALSAEELLVAIELPVSRKPSTYFFHEFARRHGDYAIAGLAAHAVVEGGGFSDLRLAFFAVGDRPVLASAATKLIQKAVTSAEVAQASAMLAEELDPQDDQQASGGMRRHLAKVLLARCVATLLDRPDLAEASA
jgi:carbon-monoxide dehydrogenase medium subunit